MRRDAARADRPEVSEYFDLSRIAELQDVLGADAGAILASMLASMTAAIERVETAIAAGELERATQDAHRARNDALMLGAEQLQQALTELEAATRAGDEVGARAALEGLREVWPPTRDELAGI
jgi:HPt (histidine-containing phosphotransfer) domain-containing protein